MSKFEGLMEVAKAQAERLKAYLIAAFLRSDAVEEEQQLVGRGRVVKAAYELSQAVRSFYLEVLEKKAENHLDKTTNPSELSDAMEGDEKTDVKIRALWASLQARIKIEDVVHSWLQSHSMKEGLRRNPFFLQSARAYVTAYLRWLVIVKLSGKSVSELEGKSEEPKEE